MIVISRETGQGWSTLISWEKGKEEDKKEDLF